MTVNEGVHIETIVSNGGEFKTKGGMQKITAAGLNVPVDVYSSAGEGGSWGMALLTLYAKENRNQKLNEFLNQKVFNELEKQSEQADQEMVNGFNTYLERYKKALEVVKEAESRF